MEYYLETEHLKLRRFEAEDAARLLDLHLDGEVRKWIPNECYANLEEARGAIRDFSEWADRKELPFVLAVELKETGELIGDAGINEVEGKEQEVEIGFVIGRGYRGKGYATEAARAMAEFAGSAFGKKALYGRVMKGNHASVRVLEKNGYRFVAEETGAEDDPYGNGMLVYLKKIR